jgi:glycosyltransferase involved in cell wall biosynthesis
VIGVLGSAAPTPMRRTPAPAPATAPARIRLLVFRTTLDQGGADRVTITLLRGLDRARFEPRLVMMKRTGVYLGDVPADVPIDCLDAASLWHCVPALTRYLRAHRPDVFFSLDSGGNIPAVMAHRLAGAPGRIVLSERNILWNGGKSAKRALQVALKGVLYRGADAVTAVSRGVGDDLAATLRLPSNRIEVVYNPMLTDDLDRQAAEPVEHPWFAEPTPIVLAAGRLVPQKDYATMIRAFAAVRAGRPARLFILGDGPARPSLEAEVARLGLGADVWFGGFDKNPFKYMARCTVFVLSSRNEGLPGSLIQAMACGAPVVSTDCPSGPSEIISEPGRNGFLVPVGDVAALAERVAHLIDHPAERAELARRGRDAVQRFEAAAAIERYAAVLVG